MFIQVNGIICVFVTARKFAWLQKLFVDGSVGSGRWSLLSLLLDLWLGAVLLRITWVSSFVTSSLIQWWWKITLSSLVPSSRQTGLARRILRIVWSKRAEYGSRSIVSLGAWGSASVKDIVWWLPCSMWAKRDLSTRGRWQSTSVSWIVACAVCASPNSSRWETRRDTSLCRTFGREWDRTRCRQHWIWGNRDILGTWAGTRRIAWSVSLLSASSTLKVACLAPVNRAPRGALSVALSWLSCATSFLSRFETFLGQHSRQNAISGDPPSVSGFWHVRRSTIWTCTPTDTPRQKNDKFYRCKRTLGLVFRLPPFLLLSSLRRPMPRRQVSRQLLDPNAVLLNGLFNVWRAHGAVFRLNGVSCDPTNSSLALPLVLRARPLLRVLFSRCANRLALRDVVEVGAGGLYLAAPRWRLPEHWQYLSEGKKCGQRKNLWRYFWAHSLQPGGAGTSGVLRLSWLVYFALVQQLSLASSTSERIRCLVFSDLLS